MEFENLKMGDVDVIVERIENLKEQFMKDLGGIHDRLDRLNGATQRNTAFRNKQTVINMVVGSVGVAGLGLAVWAIKKILGGI